jgi:tetratricopeptide (TPR) repeat protein
LPSPAPDLSNRTHPLAGHIVVFTGRLSSLARRDARALVEKLGGATADEVNARTTMLVVGAEGFADEQRESGEQGESRKSNKLRKAEELKIAVVTEEEFCRLAGVTTPETLKRQYHALRDLVARYPAVREDHVRYLMKCGVVRPVLRTNAEVFFAFADLGLIRQLNERLEQGLSFHRVARSLLAERQGQLVFDFRLDASPAKIITLRRPSPEARTAAPASMPARDAALAEEYFTLGSALDDGDAAKLEDAAAAYRKALELDPYLVAALINLANIHYSRNELVEAQALYERAIGLEPDFFEAHFNLGNIYHDLGRFPEAQACYREALQQNPRYADAHFYLAVAFEKMGQSDEARPHWRAYQQLAPQGEWVELAREFCE